MFTTPKKQKRQSLANMDAKENSPHRFHTIATTTPNSPVAAVTPLNSTTISSSNSCSITGTPRTISSSSSSSSIIFGNDRPCSKLTGTSLSSASYLTVPEIVISSNGSVIGSTHSLNRSRCELPQTPMASSTTRANNEDMAVESTALLETSTSTGDGSNGSSADHHHPAGDGSHMLADEFEQFILNHTTSDSNILESSIYSELQFPPSMHGGGSSIMSGFTGQGGYVSSSGGPITHAASPQVAGPQTPASGATASNGRSTKRTKRKHKTKAKCTATAASLAAAAASQRASPTGHYPPRYTAIFMDPHHNGGHHQYGNVMTTHHHNGSAANALGQIASAAASSPFLNPPVTGVDNAAATAAYMQQFQYFQQRPMVTTMAPLTGSGHRRHHR